MSNDDEIVIDVRKVAHILLHNWIWIIGVAVIVALATLVVSFLVPPTYEATALVAITKPLYTLNFDPRFETAPASTAAYKAYPELATSDELLQSVFTQLNPLPAPLKTLADLGDALKAEAGADPSIVRLKAQANSPLDAARMANIWADTFVTRANAIYGTQDETQVQFFVTQAAGAEKELQADEQALIDFQARDRSSILENQLSSTRQKQADYLADQRAITYLMQDIAGLRQQLSKEPASTAAGLADRLSGLFMQIKAYKAQANTPIQLQFTNPDTLATASVGEQIAFLDNLNSAIQAQLADLDTLLKELDPQILSLQQQLQTIYAERDRITRARDLARDTYTTLASKVEETRIAVQNTKGSVQLASRAAAPEKAIYPHKGANTVLGGLAGLVLGVIAAFLVEWRRGRQVAQPELREAGAPGH